MCDTRVHRFTADNSTLVRKLGQGEEKMDVSCSQQEGAHLAVSEQTPSDDVCEPESAGAEASDVATRLTSGGGFFPSALKDDAGAPCAHGASEPLGNAVESAPEDDEEPDQLTPAPSEGSLSPGPLEFAAAASSERGARLRNEDSFHVGKDIAVVSDGIGGAPYGDIISQLCCRAFEDEWKRLDSLAGSERGRWDLAEWRMARAVAAVDGFVSRVSGYLGEGSGATLVAAARDGGDMVFGRVGDSVAFVLQEDGALQPVFEESGRAAGRGNALEAALGYGMVCSRNGALRLDKVHTAKVPLREGLRVLLCSDGVWTQLEHARLAELLAGHASPYAAAHHIAHEAALAYTELSDNATAVVVHMRRPWSTDNETTPNIG